MESKLTFSKRNTLAVKGIAILMLLVYHCFSSTTRMRGRDVSFAPISMELGIEISLLCVHCVGIFLFLSAYGLTLSMKAQFAKYQFNAHEATLFAIKRYLKLFFMFALPFVFCTVITLATDTSRYSNGPLANMTGLVTDFFGLSEFFGTEMLNTTWWYLSMEVLLIVFLPLLIILYKKCGWLIVVMTFLIGSLAGRNNLHMTIYFLNIPLGICFADQHVLERLKAWSPVKNRAAGKGLKFLVSSLALLACLRLYASEWGAAHFDFALRGFIAVLIVYWSYEFLIELPVIKQVLEYLGKHSAMIFYVHSFVRSLWIGNFTYSLGHAGIILLFVLAGSLAISIFLEFVKKLIRYNQLTGRLTDGILAWADRALW